MSQEDIEQEPLVIKTESTKKKRKISRGYRILILCGVACLVIWILGVCWFFHYLKENYQPVDRAERRATAEECRKEEVLTYLEERYGEEFEIASYRGMSYAYDYVQMYAYPKGYSDEAHQFKIQGRLNEDKKMEYTDSYVMVKLIDDYETYVDEIIDEHFDDYKFYLDFNSEWITSNLPPDTTVEDLFQLRANVDYPLPDLAIFMKSSQKERFTDDNVKQMCKKLAVWGYRGSIHIRCYDDDQYYERKNNENKRECLPGEEFHWLTHVIFIYDDKNIDYR